MEVVQYSAEHRCLSLVLMLIYPSRGRAKRYKRSTHLRSFSVLLFPLILIIIFTALIHYHLHYSLHSYTVIQSSCPPTSSSTAVRSSTRLSKRKANTCSSIVTKARHHRRLKSKKYSHTLQRHHLLTHIAGTPRSSAAQLPLTRSTSANKRTLG